MQRAAAFSLGLLLVHSPSATTGSSPGCDADRASTNSPVMVLIFTIFIYWGLKTSVYFTSQGKGCRNVSQNGVEKQQEAHNYDDPYELQRRQDDQQSQEKKHIYDDPYECVQKNDLKPHEEDPDVDDDGYVIPIRPAV